jgi:uncharacterized surface protein with fasciclin (FAS1) repeats
MFTSLSGLALLASITTAQCSDSVATADVQAPTIVEVAVGNKDFSTLVTALKASCLDSTLSGHGPFTVFAPTNGAFNKLPKGTVVKLLRPESKKTLQSILVHHVVPGAFPAAKVGTASGTITVGGQWLDFKPKGKQIFIDGALVTVADIQCRNGVIHVIDTVMLPADSNLVEVASKAGGFQTLLAAASAAGLAETLQSSGPFTVFAPTDSAFASLGNETIEFLLLPENRETLASVLKHHVAQGRVYSPDAIAAGSIMTLAGTTLPITIHDGKAMVGNAHLVATDVDANNGVIHVIDTVLQPSAKVSAAQS